MADEMIDPDLIGKLSEQVFNKLYPMALELIKPIAAEHGDLIAANTLTNALVSTTGWQMGNHMKFVGAIKTDEEFQQYCTDITKALFKAFIGPDAKF